MREQTADEAGRRRPAHTRCNSHRNPAIGWNSNCLVRFASGGLGRRELPCCRSVVTGLARGRMDLEGVLRVQGSLCVEQPEFCARTAGVRPARRQAPSSSFAQSRQKGILHNSFACLRCHNLEFTGACLDYRVTQRLWRGVVNGPRRAY